MIKTNQILRILLFAMIVLVAICIVSCKNECKHDYSDKNVPATCLSGGYTEHVCLKCGDTYRDCEVASLGHSYVADVIPSTCTAEGYTKHTCSLCGDSYNDSIVSIVSHRFNGSNCIYCSFEHPVEAIVSDTTWYDETKALFFITNKEELAGLASLVNQGIDFCNTTVYLEADIDLGYAPWTPIGNADYAFNGIFVGNGHVISNLNIPAQSSYIGFFGNSMGVFSDFTIDNASVYVAGSNQNIGIVCGYSSGKVSGIKVDGYVDAKYSTNVGGLFGSVSGEFFDCESNTEVYGFDNVGGIVGSANVSISVFKAVYNYGDVYGDHYCGGIFGNLNGGTNVIYVENIHNYGDVSGKYHLGGIAGYANGKVGSVIQDTSSSACIYGEYYIGGIAGEVVNIAISNCSNDGTEINASSCVLVGEVYYAYVGGYLGKGHQIDHCINNASIEYVARGIYVGGIAGYLSNGVTECTNSGNISGYDFVGGIAGYVATPDAVIVSNLVNSGNISGKTKVGGIAGQWAYANPITLGDIINSGNIIGTSYLGGMVGYFNYSTSAMLTAYNLKSTGDVTGSEMCVGGLFGYVNGKDSSTIANSFVCANVSGRYLVGGLIGKAEYVTLLDSSNEGSTISATGFVIEGEETNVYLGGYVAVGYKISGCTNNVVIDYTSLGNYVGGIAAVATGEIQNCTNNASITSAASKVGGIAGEINSKTENTYINLVNNGNVKGTSYVGGIVGNVIQITDKAGTHRYQDDVRYEGNTMYGYSYRHYFCLITTFTEILNTGDVIATSDNVGGIIGSAYYESTYYNGDVRYHCAGGGWGCIINSQWKLEGRNLTNSGNIYGSTNIGEMIGSFKSDVASTIDNYTVIGKVTISGNEVVGTYDIGSSSNLTLTNRVGPKTENDEITEE